MGTTNQEIYLKGRGAQINTNNPYHAKEYVEEHIEGLDEPMESNPATQYYFEHSKTIVNKVDSPDLPNMYSLNPYQGCEHGCVYCYARNAHQYWGMSAGLDFERKIIIKENAPALLEQLFLKKSWTPKAIALSGNTDCYQPVEKKLEITRKVLGICAKYRNPVGIITKNRLILRDIDILADLAKDSLVHVYISITTFDESLRRIMEPRTASSKQRLLVIEKLSAAGIPCGVMAAPIIPGLNNYEIPAILKQASEAGALTAGYTIVRLNGSIENIFKDWLYKNFPERAQKVWNQISAMHGGRVHDSAFGRRMSGEGAYATTIQQLFRMSKKKFFEGKMMPEYSLTKFRKGGNLSLFD